MNRGTKISIILLILFAAFTTDLIFTLFEYDEERKEKRHPFYEGHVYASGKKWDGAVTDANFYHGFYRRVTTGLIFLCAFLAVKWRLKPGIFLFCLGLEFVDALDYWLTRNDQWAELDYLKIGPYTLYNYEIEYNHFRLLAVSIYSIFTWIKSSTYPQT